MSRALLWMAVCGTAAALPTQALGQVTNGGFETSVAFPPGFSGWNNFGFNLIDNISRDTATFRTGAASCKIFGQFNGFFQNDTGIFQDTSLALVAGHRVRASVWCRHNSADPIGDQNGISNLGFFTMFLNGGGVDHNVGGATLYASDPTDQWIQFVVEGIVPMGATNANLTAGFVQFEFNSGAIYMDDFVIEDLGPAPAGLWNASFEQADAVAGNRPAFWDIQPGINEFNATVNADVATDGAKSLLMFGLFADAPSSAVVWQELPAAPGEQFSSSVSALHGSGDPLGMNTEGTSNIAFMNLEFQNASDDILTVTSVPLLDSASPTDVWTPGSATATAPAGATKVRILLGLFQPDEPTGPAGTEPAGAAFFDDSDLVSNGPNTGLVNPGFETFVPNVEFQPDAASPFPGWTNAGFSGTNLQHAVESRTGQYGARMFGQFAGIPNDTVIFQNLPANPGDLVEATAYSRHLGVDPMTGANTSFLNIVWLDSGGGVLGFETAAGVDAASPTDTDILVTVNGSAPAGTTDAQILIGFHQEADAPGAAIWDDVTAVVTPAPDCPGDANGDLLVNFDDLNEVLAFWNTTQPVGTNGDVTGDGMVNFDDLNEVLANWNTSCL